MEAEIKTTNDNCNKIMQLALDAGTVLLSNGAEIWRVEDTISHICKAYQVDDVGHFILSNAIL